MIVIIPNTEIVKVMQGVIDNYLKPKFIELGMSATGDWLNALEARASLNKGEIWGNDYTYWLNFGRGPNKDQSQQALRAWAYWYSENVIKPWANAKGLVFDNYFGVAYNIAVNGTKKHPERINFLDVLSSQEVMDYINQEIGKYIVNELRLNIVKLARQTLN